MMNSQCPPWARQQGNMVSQVTTDSWKTI